MCSLLYHVLVLRMLGFASPKDYLIMLIEGALRSVGHPIDFFAQEAKVVTISNTAHSLAKFLIIVCFIFILPFNVY